MSDDQSLLLQARAYSDAGNYEVAYRTVGKFLALHPDHVGGLTLAGGLLSQLNRPAEALPLLGRAATLAPDDCGVLTNLAIAQRKTGDWEHSLAVSRRMVELAPEDPLVYEDCSDNLRLVWFQLDQAGGQGLQPADLGGLLDESMRYADRACQLAPDHPDAHTCRGWTFFRMGRQRQARQEFQIALSLDPDDTMARTGLASAQEETGRHAQASEGFFRLLRENPANLAARTNFLAITYAYFANYLVMILAGSCLLALLAISQGSLGLPRPVSYGVFCLVVIVALFSFSRFIRFRKQFIVVNHDPSTLTSAVAVTASAFVISVVAGVLSLAGLLDSLVTVLVLAVIVLAVVVWVSTGRKQVALSR